MSTSVNNAPYGSRGKLQGFDSGMRRVAPTFGKELFLTYSQKANGTIAVESESERFVAHMLTLDPGVRSFAAQAVTIDLIDRHIYRKRSDLEEARKRHKRLSGQKFYTPDFYVKWNLAGYTATAIEVKVEGFEGDSKDLQRIARARNIIEASGVEFLRIVWPRSQRNPLKSNLPMLVKALRRLDLWPDNEMITAVGAALESGIKTVRELCCVLSLSPNVIPIFLVSGLIAANVRDELINGAMAIKPAYGDLSSLCLVRSMAQ